MGQVNLGHRAHACRNSASFGSPTFARVSIVKEVKIKQPVAKTECTVDADNVKKYARDLLDVEVTFMLKKVKDNADYIAIKAAWLNGTDIDMWFLDGPLETVGSAGPRGDWTVADFSEDRLIGNAIFNAVTLAPSGDSANAFEPDRVVS